MNLLDEICVSKHSHPDIERGFMCFCVLSLMLYVTPAVASETKGSSINECFTFWRWKELCSLVRGAHSGLQNAVLVFWMHNMKTVPFSLVMYVLPSTGCRLRNAALWGFLDTNVGAWFQLLYAVYLQIVKFRCLNKDLCVWSILLTTLELCPGW